MIKKTSFFRRTLHILTAVLAIFLQGGCDIITEDLQPCANYLAFRYDYNLLYADAFPTQVKRIDVYVFTEEGSFVTRFHEERDSFGQDYRMPCNLPAGKYHLVVWAGLYDRSYEFLPEVKRLEELTVKMHRQPGGVQQQNLDALWHGEVTAEFTDHEIRTVTIPLVKDTNRFRIVVQGAADLGLEKESLSFSITDANGHLNYDNSLLPDEELTYRPYYQEKADLGDDEGAMDAVVAEMNTLRLLADRKPRLIIENEDGRKLVNIDLIHYLLLTKMEGHPIPAQEYLDRQDEYAMIFFLNKDALGNYLLVKIQINDWVLRPQEGDF